MVRRRPVFVKHIDPATIEGQEILERARKQVFAGLMEEPARALEARSSFEIPAKFQGIVPEGTNTTKLDEIKDFKKWLNFYFISIGHYNITPSGAQKFGNDIPLRQYTELAEQVTSREKDDVLVTKIPSSEAEKQEAAMPVINDLIREGFAEWLCENGFIERKKYFKWKDEEVRKTVIRKFVELIGKKPREVTYDDFVQNELKGLLFKYYRNSPYLALTDSGHAYSITELKKHAETKKFETDKIYPWEMNNVRIYEDKDVREATAKWLAWKLKKHPRTITLEDFKEMGVQRLTEYYNCSPYETFYAAGLVTETDEADMRSCRNKG